MQPGSATVCYFGNINTETTADALKAFAATAGKVVDVELARNNKWAYVNYASEADLNKAVEKLDDTELLGNKVKVAPSKTPTPRAPRAPKAAPESTEEVSYSDNKVVVLGLKRGSTEEALTGLLAGYAGVTKTRIQIRGNVCIVTFDTVENATKALALNGKEVDGRTVRVEKQIRRPKRKAAPKAAATTEAKAEKAPKKKSPEAIAAANAKKAAKSVRVKVTEVAEGTTADHLKAHFASAGRIVNARLNKAGTIGFVQFEDRAGVEKGITFTGTSLNGATIGVVIDASRAPRRFTPKAE